VGIGQPGSQKAVVVVEPWPEHRPKDAESKRILIEELRCLAASNTTTDSIDCFLIYPGRLPTDIRHNSKIFREQLVPWAARASG
jgi:hypothetical protein